MSPAFGGTHFFYQAAAQSKGILQFGGIVKLARLYLQSGLALILLIRCVFPAAEASAIQQRREIKPIGCFGNVRSTGEHVDGYSVHLWTAPTGLIGIIYYHRGLDGDSPMGVLTDTGYDPDSGNLAFEARLTIGLHYCRNHTGIPSKDVISFQGILKKNLLLGNIVVTDLTDSAPVVVDKRENFLMRGDGDCRLESYESYDVWRWYWEPIFKFRGPKW